MESIHTKLHLNESPFKPSGAALAKLKEGVRTVNRYPEWDGITLRSALAGHLGVGADWVIVGNGSIGVIQQAMVASGQGEIIYGWPSFEAFEIAARALRMPIHHTPLKDHACDLAAIAAVVTPQTSMIIVCTPNAPTGGIVSAADLEVFVSEVPDQVLILVDEAYGEFVGDGLGANSLSLVKAHSNVVLTRTFSKAYGLAGIRVGYGVAQPELASRITRAGLPFPTPVPFQDAALAALQDQDRLNHHITKISAERKRLANKLRKLGTKVVDGYGNFVWLPLGELAAEVARVLRAEGVLVKSVMPHGIRITVGTPKETDAICEAWERAGLSRMLDQRS